METIIEMLNLSDIKLKLKIGNYHKWLLFIEPFLFSSEFFWFSSTLIEISMKNSQKITLGTMRI